MYNKNYEGQRYSPLNQIDKLNVGRLGEVCRAKVADGGPLHAGPIVVNGLIIVTAGAETTAVDAGDCSIRWKHIHAAAARVGLPANRGVGYTDGVVYRGSADGHLFALDAMTGRLLWDVRAADTGIGEYISSAPLLWNGRLYAGIGFTEFGIRGRMMAYDSKDGHEVWRFYTIPRGTETGAQTWKHADTAATGGGGTWSSYALDPQAREVFIPVANPTPALYAAYRPGANLFTNSLVVLDADTGKLKWWYQAAAGDFHEYDLSAPPVLYEDSNGRRVVAITGKDGYVRLIDRNTHRRIFQTSVVERRNDSKPLSSRYGLRFCPGVLGGVQWNGVALDPTRRNLYVGAIEWCSTVQMHPISSVEPGRLAFGGHMVMDKSGPTGRITALDADSGDIQWQIVNTGGVVSALLPTAGGVVFVGDLSGNLLALDSDSGAELRRIPTGGAIAGGIVTYQVNGKQYIATTSGNISRLTFGGSGTPSVVVLALDANNPAHSALSTAGDASSVTADAARGRTLFAADCSSCHGASGEGGIGPSLRRLGTRLDEKHVSDWIRNPSGKMPKLYPTPLTERDVIDISAFVVSF